ncbi:hypothetical protein QW180_25785 [Vibrio sinaloensis]|nr:hypothetical protein [Vibrio sinaloensis]
MILARVIRKTSKNAQDSPQQQGQKLTAKKGQPQNDAQDSSSPSDSDKAEKKTTRSKNANQSKSEPSSAEPRQAQANKEHQK